MRMPCSTAIVVAVVVPVVGLFTSPAAAAAQTEAVTVPKGDTVVLLDNGRWEFVENYRASLAATARPIDTLAAAFGTPARAKAVEKSLTRDYALYYDRGRFTTIDAATLSPLAKKAFVSEGLAVYGILVVEEGTYPLERYDEAINAMAARSFDRFERIGADYRRVNGRLTLHTVYEGESEGIALTFHRYLQARDGYMAQYAAWRGRDDFGNESVVLDLLNGLD